MSEIEIKIGTTVIKVFGKLGVFTGEVVSVPNNGYTVEIEGTEGDIKTVTVETVPRGPGRPPSSEIGLKKEIGGEIGTIIKEPVK